MNKEENITGARVRLKMYRIKEEDVRSDGIVKLYIRLKPTGAIYMNLSLREGLLGTTHAFKDTYHPEKDELWSAKLFLGKVHTEFIDANGIMSVSLRFYRGSEGAEDKVTMMQQVDKSMVGKIDTRIGFGYSRDEDISNVINLINKAKDEYDQQ